MESKHDPLRDVVIRSDCIVNGPVYPQGGGGMILSRRAVEQLAPFGNYSIWEIWQDSPDMRIGHVMNHVFSGTSWYTSTAVLGCSLDELDFERARVANFTGLPACPDPSTLSNEDCMRFVAPLRQLVFVHIGRAFHNGAGWLKERYEIAQNLWNAPPEVSFWPSGLYSKSLCWRAGPNFTRFW